MLVAFDRHYQIRDLYYPHVGQENHAGGGPCRFGVWGELPEKKRKDGERRRSRVCWTDDGWDIKLGYQPDTLATDVRLKHEALGVELRCQDVVDFHRPLMVRRIEVANLTDEPREVRLFSHHDFHMYGTKVGDTAYYDPQLRSLIHYRKARYLMTCFYADGDQRIDEYATGTSGFHGAEGTWRDAEDGSLGDNPIAQGSVDSTMMSRVALSAGGSQIVYLVIGAGYKYDDLDEIHRFLHTTGPQGVIDRTVAYWRLWLAASRPVFPDPQQSGLPTKVEELFKRSLLIVRTQIDNGGAIIAANDSDYLQFNRDTYSYLWPRDGAFVADALDAAGFTDVTRSFFTFCAQILNNRGMFLHKYNPDGSPASSWHPWVAGGRPQLPIQEDETALVIWALWRHYVRYRDIEFVRPLWLRLIQPASDFMVRYRDPDTHLPLPSYDLWEERFGVHAFTVATVYAGLKAAWQFAVCFGDTERAQRYATAVDQTRAAFEKHMWSPKLGRFLRRIEPTDADRTAHFLEEVLAGREPHPTTGQDALPIFTHQRAPASGQTPDEVEAEVEFEADPNIDASMFAIFALGLLPADDPRVIKTMDAVADRLWIKSEVGGVARYENDYYHQVSQQTDTIPGNPWFICTLWLADYYVARARTLDELKMATRYLEWVADRALPSGVLAEQVHPQTNEPLSVSPLTWSHATVVASVVRYLSKFDALSDATTDPAPPRPRAVLDDAPLSQPRAVREHEPELTT